MEDIAHLCAYEQRYTQPDPQCPINVIHGEALPAQPNTALVLNQTRDGRSVAMVLGGGD